MPHERQFSRIFKKAFSLFLSYYFNRRIPYSPVLAADGNINEKHRLVDDLEVQRP